MGWHTCGRQNLGTDHENQCKSKVQITSWLLICTLFLVCFTWSVPWFCLMIFERAAKGIDIILECKTQVQIKRSNENPGYRSSHVCWSVPHFWTGFLDLYLGFASWSRPVWQRRSTDQFTKVDYRSLISHQRWSTDQVPRTSFLRLWTGAGLVETRWEAQIGSYAKGNSYE